MKRLILAFDLAAVFIIFATGAAAQQAAAPRPAPPPLPANTTEAFFKTSDGVKIHYLLTGATGSWVVLIHGYSDSAQRMWFNTGIAPEIAKRHRVVALDNRNHGQSDRPQPGGSGKAQDIVELMDHLQIQKAHIHGYSMGGGITGQLLGMIPGRFMTAGFGGSGLTETDPKYRAEAEALDEAMPKATGEDAAAMERFRSRVAQSRPAGSTPVSQERGPAVDLVHLNIPILAVNGSFDNPNAKTHRLWREAKIFENVVLPEKTHLTAIAAGGAPPSQQYIDVIAGFIDTYDAK
jgi:pimeloyl-ACP methyl ester carboxylesterase